MQQDVIDASRDVLSQKARSFRWAAQFLAPDVHDDAAVLYAFCRLVDDSADLAPTREHALSALAELEGQLTGARPADALMSAFLEMSERCELDLSIAQELIIGARSDLDEVIIADDVELLRYCYRVAGTVGLMMCAVLGVKEREALPFALDLGVGMQLTNICRDVAEDAGLGRVYLPETRLRHHNTSPDELLAGEAKRDRVARVVADLLEVADWYYSSADEGLRYIPPRSRLAILVASRIYRGIGVKLRENGADALAGRTIVPWTGKTVWVARAVKQFASAKVIGLARTPHHDIQLHRALSGLPGANA